MAGKKQYGLIIPSKCKQTIQRPSLFDDNSEEECEEPQQKLDTWKSKVKKKTHLEIQKVLEEDPTVYEYDSIYDDMQKQKAERKEVLTKDRKPKYIGSLMKAAEIRKKEYERRIERQIQKEREKEGNEFEDKEAFVTSSYKKKLLEKQEEEERERRQKELEERMDVTKQNDLSGFYRHFLKQTTGEEQIPTIDDKRDPKKESNIEESEKVVEDNKLSSELKRAKQAILKLKRNSSQKHNSSNSSSSSSNDDDDDDNYKEKKHHKYSSKRHDYSKSKSGDYNSDSDNQRRHIKKQKYTDSKYRRKNSSFSEDERYEKKEKHRRDSKYKSNHYHKRKYESSHSSNHKKRSHKSDKPDYSSDSCS